jgi:hypothetical protein
MDFMGQPIPDSRFAQKIKGVLNAAEEGSGKIEKMTSLEGFIRQIFKDELAKGRASKLTWNANKEMPHRMEPIGEWYPDMPYQRFGQVAVIQNRKLMNIGGQQIELSSLSDVEHTWLTKNGERKTAPSDRKTVGDAWQRHLAEAVKQDPLVCSLCRVHRADNQNERMKHLYKKHPVEFAEIVGLETATSTEDVLTSAIPDDVVEAEKRKMEDSFRCCGKFFSLQGLKIHRARKYHEPDPPPAE